jgi:cobalamin biosynthesis protein CobD/CbiB
LARRYSAEVLLAQEPERLSGVIATVLQVLARGDVTSQRKLRAAVREARGRCSDGDVAAAVELLAAYVRRETGTRGATRYRLVSSALPAQLRALIEQ